MTPSAIAPRVDGIAAIVPTSMTVVLALLAAVPLHIPGYMAVVPAFTLMGVFHWTVYRPDLLPPTIIFVIGLFLDFLTGARDPGMSPLVLLIARALVIRQRPFFVGRPFPFVWGGFALVAAATIAALWALTSALESTLLDARLSAFRWVLSVAFFPPVSYLMVRAQRALLPG
jgi:rod shape-determining protein MreD